MTITSFKTIFEPRVFEGIFECLFDASILKLLDNDEFKKLHKF
jgi:hypothetical protein